LFKSAWKSARELGFKGKQSCTPPAYISLDNGFQKASAHFFITQLGARSGPEEKDNMVV